MATAFKTFWNSPVGPKTTHFWGPVANWGFVLAGRVPAPLEPMKPKSPFDDYWYAGETECLPGENKKMVSHFWSLQITPELENETNAHIGVAPHSFLLAGEFCCCTQSDHATQQTFQIDLQIQAVQSSSFSLISKKATQ